MSQYIAIPAHNVLAIIQVGIGYVLSEYMAQMHYKQSHSTLTCVITGLVYLPVPA